PSRLRAEGVSAWQFTGSFSQLGEVHVFVAAAKFVEVFAHQGDQRTVAQALEVTGLSREIVSVDLTVLAAGKVQLLEEVFA
ncbi:hypothetical protein, partial [Klebsiella pneumoniae]|uniref:hypothetical protein n=1 Tax=Klebsiella pneumoniae TaxID=573 RepID=UPI003007F416